MNTDNILCREQESFSAHTPLRMGGYAEKWMWVFSEEDLIGLVSTLKKERWLVHWPFQDILCRNGGYPGTVIRLAGEFTRIEYHENGVTLGSAALWAQLDMGFEHAFGNWSGSVGDLFSREEEHFLKGYTRTFRWLMGKKIEEETFSENELSEYSKKNAILLSVRLEGKMRKKKHTPSKSGEIYVASKKENLAEIFIRYQLVGIRLKGWLLCSQSPSRMLHLGGSTGEELLILSQGIKERVYKISGIKIDLNIPLIGKESKHVE